MILSVTLQYLMTFLEDHCLKLKVPYTRLLPLSLQAILYSEKEKERPQEIKDD